MRDSVASLAVGRDVAREGGDARPRRAARRCRAQGGPGAAHGRTWRQAIVDYRTPCDDRILDEEFAFAVEIAATTGVRGRALGLDEVLVDAG
jgi:hypothetical protein